MSNYCEITLTAQQPIQEMLIAELAEMGFDGFEEQEDSLKAFVPEELYPHELLNILLKKYDISYTKSIIKKQNWNQLWESNFEPVQVDDFVGIRASFHPPFQNVAHELVITPKMSFGTGHHATTYLVMQMMKDLPFERAKVYDFGTGTGILSILAEKLGATEILAVDNDEWCIENASENISINHCKYIDIQKVDSINEIEPYEIILANINKNIILENLTGLYNGLKINGHLVLSGLLVTDEKDILDDCKALGLITLKVEERNGWIAISLLRVN